MAGRMVSFEVICKVVFKAVLRYLGRGLKEKIWIWRGLGGGVGFVEVAVTHGKDLRW